MELIFFGYIYLAWHRQRRRRPRKTTIVANFKSHSRAHLARQINLLFFEIDRKKSLAFENCRIISIWFVCMRVRVCLWKSESEDTFICAEFRQQKSIKSKIKRFASNQEIFIFGLENC